LPTFKYYRRLCKEQYINGGEVVVERKGLPLSHRRGEKQMNIETVVFHMNVPSVVIGTLVITAEKERKRWQQRTTAIMQNNIADFSCSCGRRQHRAPEGLRGGITTKEAELIGWRLVNGEWRCPFCCGNVEALKSVFGDFDESKFENYGRQ
jgi:hypothetical protein